MNSKIIISLFLVLFCFSSIFAKKVDKVHKNKHNHYGCLENVDIDIEDDVLILTCQYDRDLWIEITPDHKLYISGERIYLTRYQKRLVGKYYDNFMEIMERAVEMGKEGAKVGIEGAKIGLLAVKGVMKMLVSDYDEDDLEREIEYKAEELEIRTEELEEMAEELEEVAEEFEELHYTMKNEIDELNDLGWF
jgi:hypothetical protein